MSPKRCNLVVALFLYQAKIIVIITHSLHSKAVLVIPRAVLNTPSGRRRVRDFPIRLARLV